MKPRPPRKVAEAPRREHRPASETKAFQPSNFASRYAEREARGETGPRPERLVSLGVTSTWLDGFGPNRKGQLVRFEYLYDLDDTSRRYRRLVPHGTLEPLTQAPDDPESEPLGVIAAEGFRSPWHVDAAPDVMQPVT